MDVKKFFNSLWDFSFSSFVAPKVIGIIYAISLAFLMLLLLAFVLGYLSQDFLAGLLSLILAPLIGITWLLLIRIGFESLIAGIKTAENSGKILEILQEIKEKK